MNEVIFTMPSVQNVPLDVMDAEEIEIQSSEETLRECIKETLSLVESYMRD